MSHRTLRVDFGAIKTTDTDDAEPVVVLTHQVAPSTLLIVSHSDADQMQALRFFTDVRLRIDRAEKFAMGVLREITEERKRIEALEQEDAAS